jgi:hypothetical protein
MLPWQQLSKIPGQASVIFWRTFENGWKNMQAAGRLALCDHSDGVMFSENNERRQQAWLARGIIKTGHEPIGSGHARKYRPTELLWVRILVDLVDKGIEPLKTASSLAHIGAMAIFGHPFEIVMSESRILAIRPGNEGTADGFESANKALETLGSPLLDLLEHISFISELQDRIALRQLQAQLQKNRS